MPKHIVIVGAGLVGALAALALRREQPDTHITLLDASQDEPRQDPRTLALALRSQQYLAELGIWEQVGEKAVTPIQHIHISDATGPGSAPLSAEREGVPALGYVVQAQQVQTALNQCLLADRSIEWRRGVQVAAVEAFDTGNYIHLNITNSKKSTKNQSKTGESTQNSNHDIQMNITGAKKAAENIQMNMSCTQKSNSDIHLNISEVLEADLVLVTDGSQSATRNHFGIALQQQDYQQMALAGFIESDKPHQGVAYERFTEQGPMALLPCRGPSDAPDTYQNSRNLFALVLCAESTRMQELKAMSEVDFRHHAQQLFGTRAGYFKSSQRLGAFPLQFAYAERFVGHHFAVLGNACHTLHPVAGQGYNLGIRDVIALARVLREAASDGTDIMNALNQYQQNRLADYRTITTFTDSLVHLFSNSIQPLSFARRCGLKSMRIFPALAKPVARKAMGFGVERSRWR